MRNKIRLLTACVLVVILLLEWLFPYSIISFNKSYSYQPNQVFLDKYNEKLSELRFEYNQREKHDIFAEYTSYSIALLSQKWATSEAATSMSYSDLNYLLKDVRSVKESFVRLNKANLIQDPHTQEYLDSLITDYREIENQIEEIKEPYCNRLIIHNQFQDLHKEYADNLKIVDQFYYSVTNEE